MIRNTVIGYLGAFEMTNGYGKTLYMTVEELIAHGQQYSKSYTDPKGKWQTAPHDMYKKTIMRMLLIHWGYLDPHDVANMGEYDEGMEGPDRHAIDATPLDMESDEEGQPKQTEQSAPEEHRSEAQNMSDLGYEREEDEPSTTPAAAPQAVEVVNNAQVIAPESAVGAPTASLNAYEMDSKNVPYDTMGLPELKGHEKNIAARHDPADKQRLIYLAQLIDARNGTK